MNVVDYAIRLGKFLQKTEEGRKLIQFEAQIEEEFKGNDAFREYQRYAKENTSRYYFHAWDMAYRIFEHVLEDDSIEHRNMFIKTAELVSSDKDIKELASMAAAFGNIFEHLYASIVTGGDYEKAIPVTWKYKVKNAVADVQTAVERTLLIRELVLCYQRHPDLINNDSFKNYMDEREKSKILPFSNKAYEVMKEEKGLPNEVKLIFEGLFLISEAVKKGIFYGFWNMVNEIEEDELLDSDTLHGEPLREVTFSHKNNYSSFFGVGWLYGIQLGSEHVYFMAQNKKVEIGQKAERSTVTGIIYPINDRGLFENKYIEGEIT